MLENENLFALFEKRFRSHPQRVAFRMPDGTGITYGALAADAARYANALKGAGVEPGDRVSAQVAKSYAAVCLYVATLKSGAVFQPLNTAYRPAELEFFLADAEPSVLVCDPGSEAALRPLAEASGIRQVLTLDGTGAGTLAGLAAAASDDHRTVQRAADDLACLIYTSGTTGRSKGAMITHGNLASNAQTLHAFWQFEDTDMLLHALPIFHVHGLHVALHTAFLNLSEILWLQRFEPQAVLELLPRATVMMGVPTFYTRLLARDDFTRECVAHMRLFVSGSAPLLEETHCAFAERTGHAILERYGMSETGMIASNPCDGARVPGTVGYALPGVSVRIADDRGRELPRGETGEIEVKGPNVFSGYWRMPEATQEAFRKDGFFITGDLGRMEEDGRIAIVGRAKDLIISGGFNVYPKEIETQIDRLGGIGESAVIGVPHADFGEGVVAVATADGDRAPDERQVIQALSEHLAKFKLPKRVVYVDALPRNVMGKVQKAELRRRYANLLSQPD